MAKGLGYEMAVVAADEKAAITKRNKIEVLCPLCGIKMEFDPMADSWFCYSAETSRGTSFCPSFAPEPSYDEARQGLVLFTQSDARCETVRGRGGKTNVRVDGTPKADEEWV